MSGVKSFAVDLWDGYDKVCERTEDGAQICREISNYFKKRAQIEDEYAKKLLKLSETTRLTYDQRWTGKSWETYRLFQTMVMHSEDIARKHEYVAAELLNVATPLGEFRNQMKKKKDVLVDDVTVKTKEVEDTLQAMDKAKQRYVNQSKTAEADKVAHEKLEASGQLKAAMVEKWNEKLKKSKAAAQDAKNDYATALSKYNDANGVFLMETMPYYMEQFQFLDEDRATTMLTHLRRVFQLFVEIPTLLSEKYRDLVQSADTTQPQEELQAFITQHARGREKPLPLEFENMPSYGPTTSKPRSATTAIGARPPSLSISGPLELPPSDTSPGINRSRSSAGSLAGVAQSVRSRGGSSAPRPQGLDDSLGVMTLEDSSDDDQPNRRKKATKNLPFDEFVATLRAALPEDEIGGLSSRQECKSYRFRDLHTNFTPS